jgi:hypothetical protein
MANETEIGESPRNQGLGDSYLNGAVAATQAEESRGAGAMARRLDKSLDKKEIYIANAENLFQPWPEIGSAP